ncbi:MAG: S-layer homology domain-containing protein [Clostridia bacterium]|nr:S-layer homology domain-containing protein [Clostridia bacterium]
MIKRICSLILILCMSFSTFTALAYDDVENEKQKMAVELITGFGIMNPESESTFGNKTLVKRGEFALYATRLLGHNIVASSSSHGIFDDVDTTTLEGAAVDYLASVGIIPKNKREYNPNDEVTYAEAVRILLNCLGYNVVASANGGYPGGYIKTATDCELNKNVWLMTNSVLTKTDAAVLLYNALFVKPMEFSNNNTYEESEKTLMEKTWDVYEISGIVSGYEKTVIGSDRVLPDDSVEINGAVYKVGNTNIADYVGYSVKAYYREDSDGVNTISAFIEKPNANLSQTFNSEDIEVEGNNIYYYANGIRKSLKVASPAIIYNGRYYSNYDKLEDVLNIPEGEIKFIANNSSTKYNVIMVTDYKHLLIERVDKRSGRLYLKNGSASPDAVPYINDVISILPEENDVTVYIDGKAASFADIQSDDAVTMTQTLDGEEITLYVSRNTVTGKITGISDDKITINDTEYTKSKYSTTNYTISTNGTYALTTDGKILGLVDAVRTNENDYAYVLSVYAEPGPDQAFVKLFTGKGEVVTYECASKVNVNGNRKEFDQIPKSVFKSELITYATGSDGKITRINRPYDASTRMGYVNETEFIKNWNKSSVRYTDGIMGMSFVTDDTVIFSMPRFDKGNNSDYRLLTAADLTNRTYADVTCYDVDRQGRAGAMVIVEDASDSVSMGNSLFFIKQKYEAVNEDDEPICTIEGYQDGELKMLNFTEDTSSVTYEDGWMNYVGNEDFDTGYMNLNVGDAIQYNLDNEGNVGAYRLVYNNNKTIFDNEGKLKDNLSASYFEDWSGTGSVTKQDFYDDLYISFGDVQSRYMDYMLHLGLNNTDRLAYQSSRSPIQIIDYYRPINLMKASIYTYNVKSRELELGDMEDVLKEDRVFVRSKKMGELNEVMVYVEK